MPAHLIPLIAIAALVPLAACDLSQKKPETHAVDARAAGSSTAMHEQLLVPSALDPAMQPPAEAYGEAPTRNDAIGDRSIRLQGRGVNRRQQIRV